MGAVDVAEGPQVGDLAFELAPLVLRHRTGRGRDPLGRRGRLAVRLVEHHGGPRLGLGEDLVAPAPRLLGDLPAVALGVGDVVVGGLLRLGQDAYGLHVRVLGLYGRDAGPAAGDPVAEPPDLVVERGLLVQHVDELLLDLAEEGAYLFLVEAAPSEWGAPEVHRLQLGRGEPLSAREVW